MFSQLDRTVHSLVHSDATAFIVLLLPRVEALAELEASVCAGGAGQNYLTGTTDPISPTLSAMVLVAWAVGGLALGTRVLSRRDA